MSTEPVSPFAKLDIPIPIVGFTLAYVALATVAALLRGNTEFLFYIVVMCVLMVAGAVVHIRVHLSRPVLWALSVWGLAHMAGGLVSVPESWPINGEIRVLYSLWLIPGWLKYDQIVHAFGFGATTVICWQGVCAVFAGTREGASAEESLPLEPTFGVLILCACAGMGFGALNEVIEFAATLLVPETNVGGYLNTGWDLVANLVGASLAAIGIRVRHASSNRK
ncbi:MAG: hypothetical protein H8E37_03125 [Planctomycetes bacterium]|nr:hypothetical protein [Planctomycetota bacterium]